ncbi:NAD-glutamate dehydrogenase domain-containing protein [Pseudomonas glycinae]
MRRAASCHVARGGLGWSDRDEDLRTEVLGLVTASSIRSSWTSYRRM